MATAIIPIIAAAAPLLTPIISALIMRVEHLIGAGNGSTKSSMVVNAVLPIAQALATAGKIPGQLDATSLLPIVESIFQSLQAAGVVNPETAAVLAAQPIGVSTLPPGTLRITGGTLQLQIG